MRKTKRIIAMVLVIASLISVYGTVAFAASSMSGTNMSVNVVTGKRTWLVFNPKIRVENIGSTPMYVTVENPRGAILKWVVLQRNQNHVFTLQQNTEYVVRFAGNALAGAFSARGRVSAVRNIEEIY